MGLTLERVGHLRTIINHTDGLDTETCADLLQLCAEWEAGSKDAAILDALESEANADPVVLHVGHVPLKGGYRGLGLRNTGRTLRQAVTDAFLWRKPERRASLLPTSEDRT